MSIKNDRKISLQKFSNINLFERREKNYSAIKKSNHPLKLYHYMKNKKENENSEFNQIVYSFYSFQTERKKTSKPSSKKIKYNITATSIFNKTNDNFSDTTFPFYLTQTEANKLKIKGIEDEEMPIAVRIIDKGGKLKGDERKYIHIPCQLLAVVGNIFGDKIDIKNLIQNPNDKLDI